MPETTMPTAEVMPVTSEKDPVSYELAFHILPTVVEGEVQGVVDSIKKLITEAGGEVFDEESPQRFDLAYEIEKYIESKYRRFSSAHFGWVRFRLVPTNLEDLIKEIDLQKSLLRHLCVKLTKVEEANPFRFHESIADTKVKTIDVDALEEDVEGTDVSDVEVLVEEGEEVATDDTPELK